MSNSVGRNDNNLSTLGRGSLDGLHAKLGLMARYREISTVFSILAHVKLVTPGPGQI